MSITLISSSIDTSGYAYQPNASGVYYIESDVQLISSNSVAFYSSSALDDIDVILAGEIFSHSAGIHLNSDGTTGQHSATVLAGGRIVSDSSGGLFLEGDNAQAVNHGEIISANSLGIVLSMAETAHAINYGMVSSLGTAALGAAIGFTTSVENARAQNHGTLQSISISFGAVDIAATVSSHFTNTGTVTGGTASYRSTNATTEDRVTNSGLMDGDIRLGGGDDSYVSQGGTVIGTIEGEDGDDRFILDSAGQAVDGGAGEDAIYSRADISGAVAVENYYLLGAGDLSAIAGDEDNRVTGNTGDNRIEGLAGNDTLRGLAGDDEMLGGLGNDALTGGTGNDLIEGGEGDDTALGGAGDDTLSGGFGQDLLAGDQGADTYIYTEARAIGESAFADRIVFQQGSDVVDVSAIGDAAFAFIGSAGFSGSGGMELRAITAASGHGVAMFDVDGDGAEDARLVLLSTPVLTADDFVL